MTELFDAVSNRLKTIFTAHAALELEAEVIARHIERKAALLKQAAKLEEDGFKELADEFRQHAGGLDPRRPAEAVLPMLTQAPTAQKESNGQVPHVNGTASPAAEAVANGTAQVAAQIAETPAPTAVNGTATHPTADSSPLPEAVPVEPAPEPGNGRSSSRKKSR